MALPDLTGNASEIQYDDADVAALNAAIADLLPRAQHVAIGAALEKLRALLPRDESDEQLEKAWNGVRGARVAIAKAADDGELDRYDAVVKGQGAAEAQRAVEYEIAMRDDVGGYRRAELNKQAAARQRAMNLAGLRAA
jgi:hypothetical protein